MQFGSLLSHPISQAARHTASFLAICTHWLAVGVSLMCSICFGFDFLNGVAEIDGVVRKES